MAKLIYSVTMSLDGYIAGPGGDMSWMTPYLGPNPYVDDLIGGIGSLLVGNRTFRGDDPHKGTPAEGEAFGGGWSGPQIVLTHHVPEAEWPGVTFVSDFTGAVRLAREAAGDLDVNVLGADVARQCVAAGVLDEVLTFIAPVLLGDGTRLFEVPGGRTVGLERVHLSGVPLASILRFRVLPAG